MDAAKEARKKIWKAFQKVFQGNLAVQGFGFLLAIVLGRTLGVSGFGKVYLVIGAVSLVAMIVDVRAGDVVTQFMAQSLAVGDKRRAATSCWIGYVTDFCVGVTTFAALQLLAPFIATTVLRRPDDLQLPHLIRMYAFVQLLSVMDGTSFGALNALGAHKRVGWLSAFGSFLRFLFPTILILRFAMGVQGAIIGMLAASVVASSLTLVLTLRRIWIAMGLHRPQNTLAVAREMAPYAIHTFAANTFKSASRNLDVIILGRFCPDRVVGYYKLALQLCSVLTAIGGPLTFVARSTLSEMTGKKQFSELERVITRQSLEVCLASCVLALLLILGAPYIVPIWKAEFLPGVDPLKILVWAFVIETSASWLRPAVFALGAPRVTTEMNGLRMLVLVVAGVLIVPRFGDLGMAFTYLCMAVTSVGWGVWRTHRILQKLTSDKKT